jgi:transcriptional regulator with XRE-family HTH domain
MDATPPDINTRLGRRLLALRTAHALSIESLAERSSVSRSAISLIENGRSSPTATVLDKLAGALGATVASLFEPDASPAAAPSPVARVADQPVWTDPASGYRRRNVSPPGVSPIQLVDVVFPAGGRVAYDAMPREADTRQQVWMIDGEMEVTVGADTWRLQAGDCLAMGLDAAIVYRNPTRREARYLVALVTQPAGAPARSTLPARRPA